MELFGKISGAVVAGRYELAERVGQRRTGTYRARDRQTGRMVALKMLSSESSAQDTARLVHESQALAELRHPALAPFFEHGATPEGQFFVVMDWMEGEDLGRRLAERPLRVAESLALLGRVAEALALAHECGVVHGDLRPSNLMLRGGQVERVAVMDFGLARGGLGVKTVSGTEEVIGTLKYIAPEQARGERRVGPAVDVFSLGCVLYECLTGTPPFAGEHISEVLARVLCEEAPSPRRLRPELPTALEGLLERMLAKDPMERLGSGRAVVAALGQLEMLPAEAEMTPVMSPAPTVGVGERKLVSLILAKPSGRKGQGAASGGPAKVDQKMPPLEKIEPLLRPYGARVVRLADGSILATLSQVGQTAMDQATQAARAALLLGEQLSGGGVALVTGRVAGAESESLGAAIRAAVRLVQASEGDVAGAGSRPVWLDDLTAGLLDTRFHVRAFEVKCEGRRLLEGERPDETRPLLGRPTPCVGRGQELQSLEMFYDACVEEEASRAVLVLAPSGVGKSRLRHELLRRLEERGEEFTLIQGRGDLMRAGAAYGLLKQALRDWCVPRDQEPGRNAAALQARFSERVGRHVLAAERQRVVEFLGELCGVTPSGGLAGPAGIEGADGLDKAAPQSPQLRAARQDPRLMGEQVAAAWVDFLRAECAVRPVLLVLEDLHWSDAASVHLVDAALRDLAERPFLLLALGRPEARELFPRLWEGRSVQELHLSGLGRKASERLVREMLGARVTPEAVARIVDQAGGNALFLEELIRAEAEGAQGEHPETVMAMLEARLLRLEPGARRLLRAASVFGETFWRSGVQELLGSGGEAQELDRWLEMLVRAEIITREGESRFPEEAQFSFRHVLLRDAAYSLLGDEDRRVGHLLAGQYLERLGEGDPVLLAEHFQRGGERERAALCFVGAARRALASSDNEGVLEHVARGVACGVSGETLGMLRGLEAWGLLWGGNAGPEAAYAAATEALRLLPAGSAEWSRALGVLPMLGSHVEPGEVLEYVHRSVEVPPLGGAESAFLEPAASVLMMTSMLGMRQVAEGFLRRGERICAGLDEGEARVQGLLQLGTLWYRLLLEGDVYGYQTAAQAGMEAFALAGDRRFQCAMQGHLGCAQMMLGDLARGEAACRAALGQAERLKEPMVRWGLLSHFILALAEAGGAQCASEIEGLGEGFLKVSDKPSWWVGITHVALARAALMRGNLGRAGEAAGQAVAAMAVVPTGQPLGLATLSQVLLSQGRLSEARAAAEQGMVALRAVGGTCFMDVRAYLARAEAERAAGARLEGRAALVEAHQRIEQRARRIPEVAMRDRFMSAVRDHARVYELLVDGSW